MFDSSSSAAVVTAAAAAVVTAAAAAVVTAAAAAAALSLSLSPFSFSPSLLLSFSLSLSLYIYLPLPSLTPQFRQKDGETPESESTTDPTKMSWTYTGPRNTEKEGMQNAGVRRTKTYSIEDGEIVLRENIQCQA